MKTKFAIVLASLLIAPLAQAQCVGDVAVDSRVDGGDLGALISNWGPINPNSPVSRASDLNGDGSVNGADLGLLLTNWGYCPSSIGSVSPSFGVPAGGTLLTITGENLNYVTDVYVGGRAASSVTILNAGHLTVVAPPGAGGSIADIVVAGPQGTATLAAAFRYVAVPAWATLVELVPDPAVVTDAALRDAVVSTGFAWRVRETSTQVEMLLVPPGAFQMGCTDESPGGCTSAELPVHTVTLTNPVYLGRFEITQGQFLNTMNFNPAFFSIWWYSPGMPVEQVTWDSIQGYLARTGFRLPTEAEWEFACRAGTTTAFYNGSNDDTGLGSLGWYVGNSIGLTHGVGEKQPNRLGFYDMAGNVWEWVSDFYGPYSAEAQVNPTGAMSGTRVLRGGSFTDGSGSLRSSSRMAASPDVLYYRNGGFRVARNP